MKMYLHKSQNRRQYNNNLIAKYFVLTKFPKSSSQYAFTGFHQPHHVFYQNNSVIKKTVLIKENKSLKMHLR